MTIVTHELENREIAIQLTERFDFRSVHEFRTCYEGINTNRYSSICIDFSSTKQMDSSALGMLINLKKYFESSDIKVTIANCNPQIQKIFSISNFEKLFDFV